MGSWIKHVPVLAAALLAACATTPSGRESADHQVAIDTHLLLGDVALERQQLETAAEEYLAAALLSERPGIAERATRVAHEVDLNELGMRAVARWRALAPMDERPYWFSGVFETRAGRIDRAIEDFDTFIRRLGDDAAGLALVFEAVGAEPNPGAATAIMAELTERFPGTSAGHYALARLAIRSSDFDLALENARAATELEPDWLDAQLLLARTLLVAGRSQEALDVAAALAAEHDEVEVQLQYAELLLSAGRGEQAKQRLDEILRTNPGLPEAVRALAFLALTEGRMEEAEQRFGELRSDPRYRSEAFYYLGRIAETKGDFLQATRSYARVTEGAHAVEAQLRTARIMLTELDDADGALRHLREFGEANPRFSSNMLVAQGQLLLQMGQPEQAMQLIRDALAAAPHDQNLHAAHVQLYVILAQDAADRGELDKAESILEEGLEQYEGDQSLRYSQALLYEDQGKGRKAVELLEQLVAENPDDSALLNALGYLLTDQFDRHEEARRYIQRALAMDPDNPAIIDSMGWVLFRLGDYEASLDYLERAYRLEQDPEIAAHLVDVHWALGHRERALELLRTTLEQHPESRHLREVSRRLGQ
ncbi:MAG TPA: tetratricopeptide repeat protein [Gammaproteobacteria bacterium]